MEEQIKDILVNGEIYLKRRPEIFDPSSNIEKYDEKISDLEFELSKENPNFKYSSILEGYKGLKGLAESVRGELDYSGTDKFWQLYTADGKNLTLYECDEFFPSKKSYSSVEKMKQEFVKLSEFLEKATFVGCEFRRTKSIKSTSGKDDISFTYSAAKYDDTKYIVLYATKELFLIKRIDKMFKPEEEYDLINSRYILDGNYEFFGPVYEEYKDKTKVYREIAKQIEKYNKEKRKYR